MFGYIRPLAAELRVKEYAYYRAVYCGVCKSMEKTVSPLLSMTLRYDYVLLVMVRMLLSGETGSLQAARCLANPFRKKTALSDSETLRYTSRAAALLTHYGVLDNIADEHGIKRLAYRLLSSPAAAMRRRALRQDTSLVPLDERLRTSLSALAALEQAGEPSPDAAAEPFGILLGAMFAHGLAGTSARIADTVGAAVGRCIYLLDAADDAPEDEAAGAYNPFVRQASAEGIPVRDYLQTHRARIENAVLLSCQTAYRALLLADGYESHPAWPCIENLLQLGIPHTAKQVLDSPGRPLSRSDPAFPTENTQ
ncbi:MAG: hypothetical protein IJW77_03600 [Clostridia bacterium]|nr:hypothetical protein [Clostridia bacterium]